MASSLPISQEELKKFLLAAKSVTEDDWQKADKNAHRRRRKIEEVLVERGFFDERYLYELVSDKINVPYVNLRKRKLEPEVLAKLDKKTAKAAQAIPFAVEGDMIRVAFVDPLDKQKLALVESVLGKKTLPHLTSEKNFFFAARLYEKNIKEELSQIISKQIVSGKSLKKVEIPVIKIVDAILEYAIFDQASDIHIEALPDAVVVRFRIDGE